MKTLNLPEPKAPQFHVKHFEMTLAIPLEDQSKISTPRFIEAVNVAARAYLRGINLETGLSIIECKREADNE